MEIILLISYDPGKMKVSRKKIESTNANESKPGGQWISQA